MPNPNALRTDYDTSGVETQVMPFPIRLEFNYDTGNFEQVADAPDEAADDGPTAAEMHHAAINAERGSKAMATTMTKPATIDPAEITSITIDLDRLPERIRQICLSQRQVFAVADKGLCSFNLFTAHPDDYGQKTFNKDTQGFKQTISRYAFWDEDRSSLHEYGETRQLEDAIALSDSMRAAERERDLPPTIYVLRGGPGSGKTFAARNAGFPGMIIKDGEPVGTLATDNSKTDLYHAGGTSDQIHGESALMYRQLKRQWLDYVLTRGGDCSEIHDRVFDDPDDINEIIQNATETGRRAVFLDIDVPYVVSAVRVLLRPKDDPQPHPGDKYMEKTFRKVRESRVAARDGSILCDDGDPSHTGQLIRAANDDGLDIEYRLLCYDYESEPKVIQKEAAHLERDPETGKTHLVITDEKLYHRATDPVAIEEEIAKVRDQVINQEFVDWYCDTFFNQDADSQPYINEVRAALAEYVERGLTIYQALNDKNL